MKNTEMLGSLAPQNPEQERTFRDAINRLLRDIKERRSRIDETPLFVATHKLRKDTDGFSKDREMRMVALIPPELYEAARKKYGDDVLTNKAKFREAFVKDEVGRYCLTVEPGTI